MTKRSFFLFAICSLIWGTTWFVIKFQIESTSPIMAVFYRYLLATFFMFFINFTFIKKSLRYPLANHKFFMLQGLFNFCLNYILTYTSEKYINSGLVALTFTSLIYFNMGGMKLFFKKKISPSVWAGAALGCLGIMCLFWKEISSENFGSKTFYGIFIALVATFFASIGNMFATYNHQQKIPVMTFNAFSMMYGAFFSFIFALIMNESFKVTLNFSFLTSLLYLSFFGTVVAFWAYQTLVGELGAEKAAYTSIISPVIAVFMSNYFEKVPYTKELLLGMGLCFLGNYFALKKNH